MYLFRRRELVTTDTLEKAMARPASSGARVNVTSVKARIIGINTPAAMGIPIILYPNAHT